jgi:site-specific DNA-methyltransferase (adenine-specific)
MHISYFDRTQLHQQLPSQPDASFDFIILITGALAGPDENLPLSYLDEYIRLLKAGGILFVQGTPETLPGVGVYLDKRLTFKYWLAVKSSFRAGRLPSAHAGVLLFAKGRAPLKRARLPHQSCRACGKPLKDWGGKTHLMNPAGYVLSDVVKDLPPLDNYNYLSEPLFQLLLELLDFPDNAQVAGLVAPAEGTYSLENSCRPAAVVPVAAPPVTQKYFDPIRQGEILEMLRAQPDESVDLAFADPPYNLDKHYTLYRDEQAAAQYLAWCNAWLAEYARILKPTGSLYVLNLPRWAMHHAVFLNERLHFQNWIVWDALSEPRGKIMPAHYALLFYTKHPTDFTFNYEQVGAIDAPGYCLRAACLRARKAAHDEEKVPLCDIWTDIHRIKHRRDRDQHPCQLPDALMQRIILLSTNPGDLVLDALAGTGTTPLNALQLGRHYQASDLDPHYVQIMEEKQAQIRQWGYIPRVGVKKPSSPVTKKALQLELRQLAAELGRLPTPEDVQAKGTHDLGLFLELFPMWGKALKAAKLAVQSKD